MSYLPLALKYRPKDFSELVGQKSCATILKNAITLKRIPQALIFSGIRGTGKTSLGRIFAKAINCERSTNGISCNLCQSCLAITHSTHEDVIEIDGASNNSVEEMRNLLETVAYLPKRSPHKVYIIDEVHMLSISAFNALLKTLEEPPRNVLFIFATTELQKIPKTILGRCQSFQLKRLSVDETVDHLEKILQKENIPFEKESLTLLAQSTEGSLRDSLMFLDQVISFGDGKVTENLVAELTGSLSSRLILEFLGALLEKNITSCLNKIEEAEKKGANYKTLFQNLLQSLRHCLIAKEASNNSDLFKNLHLSENEEKTLINLAENQSNQVMNTLFTSLLQTLNTFDGSFMDRYVAENICFEWVYKTQDLKNTHETIFIKENFVKENLAEQNFTEQKEPLLVQNSNIPFEKNLLSLEKKQKNLLSYSEKLSSSKKELQIPKKISIPSNKISKSQNSVNQNTAEPEPLFPTSWRALVDKWKEIHPIHARRLEELYPITYTNQKILLAYTSEGIGSSALMNKDFLEKIKKDFFEYFGFLGDLEIIQKQDLEGRNNSNPSTGENLQKISSNLSILEEKEQELEILQKKTEEKVRSNSLIEGLITNLKSEIKNTQLK